MNVTPTGAIFYGVCQVLSEYCSAREGGAVTAVHTVKEQINVCKICLDHKIRIRDWKIEGAFVHGMRQQLDLALLDDSGRVIIAVEVKNWGHPTRTWATKIAEQITSRQQLSSIPFLCLVTPSSCYIWEMNQGFINDESIIEIDISSYVKSTLEKLKIKEDEVVINDGAEFRGSPFLSAKKHMHLERTMMHLFNDKEFIAILPRVLFKDNDLFKVAMEYVLQSA